MPAGRPPKPIPLREITGNAGHRPLPKVAAEPAPASLEPPAHLTPAAAELWRRYAPLAAGRGCLTVMDTLKFEQAIRLMALANAHLAVAEAPLRSGRVPKRLKVNPSTYIALKLIERGGSILGLFGFSPSERAKLHLPPPNDDTNPAKSFANRRPARPA